MLCGCCDYFLIIHINDYAFFVFFLSLMLQSRSVFVKNLNFKTADESLKKHFSDHMKEGRILSARVIILVLRTFNVIYT